MYYSHVRLHSIFFAQVNSGKSFGVNWSSIWTIDPIVNGPPVSGIFQNFHVCKTLSLTIGYRRLRKNVKCLSKYVAITAVLCMLSN